VQQAVVGGRGTGGKGRRRNGRCLALQAASTKTDDPPPPAHCSSLPSPCPAAAGRHGALRPQAAGRLPARGGA
jgi:hypothetical protein